MCVICDVGCLLRYMSVEERGYLRYCWRAGVMSKGKGREEGELLVWRVFL